MTTFLLSTTHCPHDLRLRSVQRRPQPAAIYYLAQFERKLDPKGQQCLCELLEAKLVDIIEPGALVVDLPGMRSAWSRNVAKIMDDCGLKAASIERAWLFGPDQDPEFDQLLQAILPNASVASWTRHRTSQAVQPSGARKPDAQAPSSPISPATVVRRLSQAGFHIDAQVAVHVASLFAKLRRDPHPAELALLAQLNSDHCSHRTFKASWPDAPNPAPLLERLKATYSASPDDVLVAYTDNAAVMEASIAESFGPDSPDGDEGADGGGWSTARRNAVSRHLLLKAETHNHPTALAPFEGAATGVGGEIRDEAATGRGGIPLAGFSGYIVAALEGGAGKLPDGLRSSWEILLDAPLGASAYANEFGRPCVAGFMRSFAAKSESGQNFGFAKPVMLAGGVGLINAAAASKRRPQPGDWLALLGGAGARVGVGGASASSTSLGVQGNALAQASVQRSFPEMQRRAQEVLNQCTAASSNPIIAIHDVGAGGLGSAVAEILCFGGKADDSSCGCQIDLALAPADQDNLDASEILVNEAQERYVVVVKAADRAQLEAMAAREACPLAMLGKITDSSHFLAIHHGKPVLELPRAKLMAPAGTLAGVEGKARAGRKTSVGLRGVDLAAACAAVLEHPAVGDKSFLTTIADRGVGGLVARDQHVGPWQVACADCAVVRTSHRSRRGCAFGLGERAPLAALDPAAAARVAVAEALTNLASAPVGALPRQKLALNWMADSSTKEGQNQLYRAVDGVTSKFLKRLRLAVIAGKDSVSMRAKLNSASGGHPQAAPAMCVATACGTLPDVNKAVTPQLSGLADTVLMVLPVNGRLPLAGSVLAQCFEREGNDVPDVGASQLANWWRAIMALHRDGLLLAYHDISDGGVLAAIVEMAFCANQGVTLVLDALCLGADGGDADGFENSSNSLAAGGIADALAVLFAETPGAVIEVRRADAARALDLAASARADPLPQTIGRPSSDRKLRIYKNAQCILESPLAKLHSHWSSLSTKVRGERDGKLEAAPLPSAALGVGPGLYATPHVPVKVVKKGRRPAAVVLRAVGSNGQVEMAAALDQAGFAVRMISLAQLGSGERELGKQGLLVLPGGFSHGDALGAGTGQAQTILRNARLRKIFSEFLAATGTLALGVCNGCQVLSQLGDLLAASCSLPHFEANLSQRFESRLAMVEVVDSPSPMLAPLAGLRLPVQVACGEGRAVVVGDEQKPPAPGALRFIGPDGLPAPGYPHDPCGSSGALCGFASPDGKLTLLMPHPERCVLPEQMSWCPPAWRGRSHTPWHDFFVNARNHLVAS